MRRSNRMIGFFSGSIGGRGEEDLQSGEDEKSAENQNHPVPLHERRSDRNENHPEEQGPEDTVEKDAVLVLRWNR